MALVKKLPEDLKWRLEFGKGGLELRGLIVNVRNTKMMVISENVGKREMITTILISSCHWETFVPFYVQKKRPENAFVTLTVNYRKIVQKNKLCYPKITINWLFNDL